MSDNIFLKIVKGAAKLGASYMASTADSLSRNSSYSDERREQFRNVHSAFSDMQDRLSDHTAPSNYDVDYYDDCSYLEEYDRTDVVVSSEAKQNDSNDLKASSKPIVSKCFSQMTFAGYQWYMIQRNKSTVLLLSKDILEVMPFSKSRNNKKYQTNTVYKWLQNDFQSQLKNKLKDKDKERLLKIFLLSSKKIEAYIPSAKARKIEEKDGISNWWLSDGKGQFIKIIKSDGTVGTAIPIESYGVRPAILVKLKEKSR